MTYLQYCSRDHTDSRICFWSWKIFFFFIAKHFKLSSLISFQKMTSVQSSLSVSSNGIARLLNFGNKKVYLIGICNVGFVGVTLKLLLLWSTQFLVLSRIFAILWLKIYLIFFVKEKAYFGFAVSTNLFVYFEYVPCILLTVIISFLFYWLSFPH